MEGNLYLGGETLEGSDGYEDVYLAKFDRSLNPLWIRYFRTPGVVDAFGGIAYDPIERTVYQAVALSNVVLKYNAVSGDLVWTIPQGGYSSDIAVHNGTLLMFGGQNVTAIDSDGKAKWCRGGIVPPQAMRRSQFGVSNSTLFIPDWTLAYDPAGDHQSILRLSTLTGEPLP